MERLDKILAGTGRWSRKEARELVRAGRVTVNGVLAKSVEEKTAREGLDLRVDGVPAGGARFCYLMLHKPAGLICATEDLKQKTVLDLLPAHLRQIGVFPAGRLDKDTEGLLLLTNDGAVAHRILSPRWHVDKVYLVQVDGQPDAEDVRMFAQGMVLGDGLRCLPADLALLPEAHSAQITIREGKYHQIKRMFAARGKPVRYLKRLSIGPLALDPALKPGEWRQLTREELESLQKIGLDQPENA